MVSRLSGSVSRPDDRVSDDPSSVELASADPREPDEPERPAHQTGHPARAGSARRRSDSDLSLLELWLLCDVPP